MYTDIILFWLTIVQGNKTRLTTAQLNTSSNMWIVLAVKDWGWKDLFSMLQSFFESLFKDKMHLGAITFYNKTLAIQFYNKILKMFLRGDKLPLPMSCKCKRVGTINWLKWTMPFVGNFSNVLNFLSAVHFFNQTTVNHQLLWTKRISGEFLNKL